MNNIKIKEVIERIDRYTAKQYLKDNKPEIKVFYNWYEWSGWRFYLKALWYRDFKSIKGHIKREYFN